MSADGAGSSPTGGARPGARALGALCVLAIQTLIIRYVSNLTERDGPAQVLSLRNGALDSIAT